MIFPLDSYESFVRHLGDREYFGQKLGLERIEALLKRLGQPHQKFRSIHIAGTNGKGSTAAMIAAVLEEAGYKTGLYTSPHLEDFCERIRINGELIPQDQVLRLARHIREVEEDPLTFFELATAIGFSHFAESRVDIAVIETGLGGRLDATNVIDPMLSVITSIGFDHRNHLGDSLAEIAFEKAGIIKPHRPVVVGALPDEAMEVMREQATKKVSRLVPVVMNLIPPNIRIRLPGAHQRHNANLALAAVDVLNALGEIHVSRDAVWRGLERVEWPGRLETVSEEPWILLDGAHNPEAMRVVREYLEENLQGRRLKVLFGAMADKEIGAMLSELTSLASEFWLVSPDLQRAASVETLRALLEDFEGHAKAFSSMEEALEEIALLAPEEVLLVTGSFYVAGEVRKLLAKDF